MNISNKWKELKTPYMLTMLKRGIRKAKRNKVRCPDGSMLNLIYYINPKTKWKYQVEYIHDVRWHKKPFVAVYAFNPKITGCERADYYLIKEI